MGHSPSVWNFRWYIWLAIWLRRKDDQRCGIIQILGKLLMIPWDGLEFIRKNIEGLTSRISKEVSEVIQNVGIFMFQRILCKGDSQGSLRPFQMVPKFKTIFIKLRCCLQLALTIFRQHGVAFFRGCMIGDTSTYWLWSQVGESSCLLVSQTLRKLAKMQNNAMLASHYFIFIQMLFVNIKWNYYF